MNNIHNNITQIQPFLSPDQLWLIDENKVHETQVDGGEVPVFDSIPFHLSEKRLIHCHGHHGHPPYHCHQHHDHHQPGPSSSCPRPTSRERSRRMEAEDGRGEANTVCKKRFITIYCCNKKKLRSFVMMAFCKNRFTWHFLLKLSQKFWWNDVM